ncbi:MAG: beta-lactamase family protein [Pseudomonas sp.]|jgi:CubicO group peptidase (beta-lactamase class C family)|uniref:CubicO group peptidase, beta-lactamase class C family n=1 Tax=Pseudomonas psychrophila TaxID=122355 RepID=A0ABY0VPZ3_9PSED|nr:MULTISPECIES: serine hydrolase domain-containing protein [Pseudomonas]KAB0493519.1 beta-lactamase family protein [Pseudomonas psychrophila]KMN02613.1 hypothetical protein TU76_02305 [Pseudomonas psychrophila]MBL1307485.1 beta-lactamase family protein [Pseudomonas sp.]QIE32412.1 beta-lactamase family protein [Pseudomonas psychrophila]WVI98956.1 serine hydrolase domain-containing protein [Pseudomonas psychrophila]
MTKQAMGLVPERLAQIKRAIEEDVSKGVYFGAVIRVTRNGEAGLEEAIGWEDETRQKALSTNSVFSIFSLTKAFVNILTLAAIERGQFALTTKVADVIPEFRGAPRDGVTVKHLLTHTTGMPGVWVPKPDMYQDRLDEMLDAICENVHGAVLPGERCDYAPAVNHILLGELLRKTDPQGRDLRTLIHQDLFEPLGMTDTWMGVRPDLRERKVVPQMRGVIPIACLGRTQSGRYSLFEEEVNEAAHVGAVSTTADLSRFAEMLRRGGELDGTRILAPRTIEVARKNWTGDLYNELYRTVALRAGWTTPPKACIGLGFNVRGADLVHHQFGTLTSEETFGNYGAGTGLFWVDPVLNMTFTCLSAGVLPQARNIERFQRLSDMAVAAAI